MKSKPERERQDWAIVLIILLIGFLCVIVAGQWALRFSPSWKLDADMESNVDLNGEFLTSKPGGFIEPVDPAILTQPGWVSVFLTPGADFVTGTPPPPLPPPTTAVPTQTPLVPTNTIAVTNTTAPTNTFVWLPLPATATRRPPNTSAPPADTPTNPPPPSADLHITMDDGTGSYTPPGPLTYTIIVTSTSAFDVIGATVTDILSAQITGATWTCLAAGGATCTPAGGGSINDTVNIPAVAGASVTYTITAPISGFAVGPLINTASVTAPAGITETNPGDNSFTDSNAGPGGGPGGLVNIGPGDGFYTSPPSGTSFTMVIPAIVADGTGAYDFVFYERVAAAPAPPPATDPRVDMDWVQVEISSDGSTWFTVFYWGEPPPGGSADSNTNVAIPIDWCPTEVDNCSILTTSLYNSTGIAIDIDSLGLSGSYPWVRITAPPGDLDGFGDIDAIQPYYP